MAVMEQNPSWKGLRAPNAHTPIPFKVSFINVLCFVSGSSQLAILNRLLL
jgi:hypothetical protein